MVGLTRNQINEKTALLVKLSRLSESINDEIKLLNCMIEINRDKIECLVNKYNEILDQFGSLQERISTNLSATYDEFPEGWQVSLEGTKIYKLISEWQYTDVCDLYINLPDIIEEPSYSHEVLRNLPETV